MNNTGLAFHVHHNKMIEYCYDYQERIEAIRRDKPKNEIEIRLKLFKLLTPEALSELPDRVSKARQEWDKARQEWDKASQELYKARQEWDKASQEWGDKESFHTFLIAKELCELLKIGQWR